MLTLFRHRFFARLFPHTLPRRQQSRAQSSFAEQAAQPSRLQKTPPYHASVSPLQLAIGGASMADSRTSMRSLSSLKVCRFSVVFRVWSCLGNDTIPNGDARYVFLLPELAKFLTTNVFTSLESLKNFTKS